MNTIFTRLNSLSRSGQRASPQWARPEGVLASTTVICARSKLDFICACVASADYAQDEQSSKEGAFATCLVVEESTELLGMRRAIEGSGVQWLSVCPELCKSTGTGRTGELVTVHLRQRLN